MIHHRIASRPIPRYGWFLMSALAACLLTAPPVAAQERESRPLSADDLEEILDGLERGMVALKQLGRGDELERLERVADGVRREIHQERAPRERERRGGRDEREVVRQQIETLKLALPALREAEKPDLAEMVENAIRGLQVMLEGRRDAEAMKIRERVPHREQIVEILGHAAHLYREFGDEERAGALDRLRKELWPGRERHRAERDRPRQERQSDREARRKQETRKEREVARHHLEIIRSAMPALLEKGRRDTAELLEHAIHARELALEGRRDEKAIHIRETAPNLEQQVEILRYAADLWKEFGHPERAGPLDELASAMLAHREGQGRRERDVHRERDVRRERDVHRERVNREEREATKYQIEVMQMAKKALAEANKLDAADIMKRSIQVRKVNLEGMRGEEAKMVRARAPSLEQEVEILSLASRMWQEFGHEEEAHAVGALAERMWAQAKRRDQVEGREREMRRRDRRPERGGREMEEIHHRINQLEKIIDRLAGELKELKGSLR